MTVAVAYQVSSDSHALALQVAAREAAFRGAELAVLHVVQGLDLDVGDAYRRGLADEVEQALLETGATSRSWRLELGVAQDDQVAATVLELATEVAASVLVIGARRRSPVGKFLLGSVTQTLILEAEMPVIVVKPPR